MFGWGAVSPISSLLVAGVAGRGVASLLLHTHVSKEVVVMEHPTKRSAAQVGVEPAARAACLYQLRLGHDCRLSALDCAAQFADATGVPPRPFRAVRAGGYDDTAPLSGS